MTGKLLDRFKLSTKQKKIASAATAATLAAAILLSGTFAWQSISQTAKNQASGYANPGGRLHDYFNGENKDVFVENFTDPDDNGVPIFARIRLDEYMEIGEGAFFGCSGLRTVTLRTVQAPDLGGDLEEGMLAFSPGITIVAPEDADQESYSGGQWGNYKVEFTGERVKPEPVAGLVEIHLAGGYEHSLAVRTDGTLWSWGSNDYGQLGDGSRESRDYPAQVPGLQDVAAVNQGKIPDVNALVQEVLDQKEEST